MPAREPSWWYARETRWPAIGLHPIATIWGALAERRMARGASERAARPVICIGNFTAGGTGKTPMALHLANLLIARGHKPGFLTRGYGARAKAPRLVDVEHDSAAETGDEALLLARAGPVMVAAHRAEGARALIEAQPGCTVILMDDGLQNPTLFKDFSIALVDGARGFGNGRCIPAGPLRAPLLKQIEHVGAIVINGTDDLDAASRRVITANFRGPILRASSIPTGDTAWLAGLDVLAYAGIGNPSRFFDLLERLGANIVARQVFADHHAFSESDAHRLLDEAAHRGCQLVTTEKDHVRLSGPGQERAALRTRTRTVPIKLAVSPADERRLIALVEEAIARHAG